MRIRRLIVSFVCSLVLSCVLAATSHAAINRQVAFQGRIVDAAGLPVADGQYNLEFKLHTDPTVAGGGQGTCSGSCIWMETRELANKVTVNDGLFSVQLGSVSSLAAVNFDVSTLYVSLRVGGSGDPAVWDVEMTPRERLAAAPQAFRAEVSEGVACTACIGVAELGVDSVGASEIADGSVGVLDLATDSVDAAEIAANAVGTGEIANGAVALVDLAGNSVDSSKVVDGSLVDADLAAGVAVPIGTILPYWGTTPPAGYLLAQGQVVSCATYVTLCAIRGAVGTTSLPDLRGRTAIGVDAGANRVTSNNTLGAASGAQTANNGAATIGHSLAAPDHSHTYSGSSVTADSNAGAGPVRNGTTSTLWGNFAWMNHVHGFSWSGTTSGASALALTGSIPSPTVLQPYQVVNYMIRVS